jgi:hypothetical protein
MNNKLLKYMKRNLQTLAVAGLVAAATSISQAQPYFLTGDAAILGPWNPGLVQMTGGPTTYSYVIAPGTGTPGAEPQYKVTDGTWNNGWPSNGKNVTTKYDADGGNTIYFYPGIILDGWFPPADRVGYADPGNLAFEVAGGFNGWSSDPAYQLNPVGNGVYSNSIVVATAGTYGFKFRTPGSWNDLYFGADFGNGGNDASLTTTTSPQTVPIVLDLPNGRWFAVSAAPPPVTNTVVFSLDMTAQVEAGAFDPSLDTVQCRGDWNGWSGVFVLTNNPNGVNINLYVGVTSIVNSPGHTYGYKFWDSDAKVGNNGYESPASTGGGNRTFSLLSANGTITLPSVSFGDITSTNSYLNEDTLVTFTVNMTNAVDTSNVVFNPSADHVAINGNWIPWWTWGFDPVGGTWGPYELANDPVGSGLYSITLTIPRGYPLALTYKYSLNGNDDELPAFVNHVHYIRNLGSYTLPLDTFGTSGTEPQLGSINLGAPSAGHIPVSWVGLPSAYLQTASSVSGPWADHTDTSAYGSPSGIYSTNYPMSGDAIFFRVVK